MSRHDSSHSSDSKKCAKKYDKKCDKISLKIPRQALIDFEDLIKKLDRDLDYVYRETNRNPILAYRKFERVMYNFSVKVNQINDYILKSLGLTKAMSNRQYQFQFPQMAPMPQVIPQPPTVTPPLLPPVTPPPRPPAVPPPGLLQVTAIRNILRQAIREVRRLTRELLFLFNFIESLNISGDVKESLELYIDTLYFAQIEAVYARATADILTVLTGI